MTQFKKGDLVRSVGVDWTDRYLDKIFMVIDVIDLYADEGEGVLILIDHIGSGTIRAYFDEVVKV